MSDGDPIHHLSSTVVPGDEMCLSLFEASSSAALRDAFGRAELSFERLSEARHVVGDVRAETAREKP